MQTDFEFSINGDIRRSGGAPVAFSLRDYLLDEQARLEKAPLSRDVCPVLLVTHDARQQPVLRLVHSCCLTLPMLAGREIWTVDAIGGQEQQVDSLQEALCIAQRLSCHCADQTLSVLSGESHAKRVKSNVGGEQHGKNGFAGFPAALKALLQEQKEDQPDTAERTISEVTYNGMESAFSYMDPSGDLFFRPASLNAALKLLQAHPGAEIAVGDTLYAGRTSFPGAPRVIVCLDSAVQLGQVSLEDGRWHVGGAVTLRALTEATNGKFPLIEKMAMVMGSLTRKNRLTVSGGLLDERQNPELLTLLLALDAQVVMGSLGGERHLMLHDCLGGVLSSALKRGEIPSGVLLQCPGSGGDEAGGHHLSGFFSIARRHSGEGAMICAAFSVMVDAQGRVEEARLCYGGIGQYALRATESEELLKGGLWGPKLAGRVERGLRGEFSGRVTGAESGGEYRNAMVCGLWRKFFAENRTPGELDPLLQGFGNGMAPAPSVPEKC
ncbi:MAG: FAD binding domain-containing protein [Verrucomicrobiales bacterium]|nr:FAD binding domain-containing protein [Verrucomicrobiales bacterium]